MSRFPAPVRFLTLVVGGWVGMRVAMLSLGDIAASGEASAPEIASIHPQSMFERRGQPRPVGTLATPAPHRIFSDQMARRWSIHSSLVDVRQPSLAAATGESPPFIAATIPQGGLPVAQPGSQLGFAPLALPLASPSRRGSRFSGTAWLFVRDGDGGPSLAPGGELGGSQAGARITYRLAGNRTPLALSARAYLPIGRPEGAEAAVGIDWRPLASVPLNLLVERREALRGDARSDFSVTLYGGGERRLAGGRVRVEAYGQAGAVGHEDPDLFADGLVRATTPVGPVDVGGGVWGGAQPGASRLDAGPHVSARLPVAGANVRISAEWRFRIAGDAAPGSGPALTIASDF